MFIQRLRKYSKPLICISGCLLFVVGTCAFAQGTISPTQAKLNDAQFLNQMVQLLAWLWMPLAMIAGKLMTNTFVFGEFMNFDIYLRGMWNMTKVFANIAIGFFFLGWIYTLIFKPEKMTGSEVGKTIGGFLLAGVLIQASWFLVGATIDIEKITTSAAGALPALVIQENSEWGKSMILSMQESGILGRTLSLDKTDNGSLDFNISDESLAEEYSNERILDSILPSYNSLSGPLYFIGFTLFRFQEYANVDLNSTNNIQDISQVLTATTIKILVQLSFVVFMFLLVLINIVRVGYLWIVIALSPLIILLIVMKEVVGIDFLKDKADALGIKIDIPTILAYIFQPTIIVIFLSLTLIAVTALWQGMGTGDITIQDYAGLTITNTGATHPTFEFSSQGDVFDNFSENGKGIFKNLIMMGLVMALLIGMIVLSAKAMKITFIETIAKNLGKALTNIPMIPIATMQTFGKNELAKAGINVSNGNIRFDQKAGDDFREMLGLPREMSVVDNNELGKLTHNPTQFFHKAQDIRDKRKNNGLSLNDNAAFKQSLVSLINNIKGDNKYGFTGFNIGELQKDGKSILTGGVLDVNNLGAYLSNKQNHQALYQWMYHANYNAIKSLNEAPKGSTQFSNPNNIMSEKFIDTSDTKTP